MAFAITINGRPDAFFAEAGESLLAAGRRAGFTFPQACRNGNCLRCEARLLCGQVRNMRVPDSARVDAGTATILPCVVTAESDCALVVEGVYGPGELPVCDVRAQVVAVEPLNHNVARIRLRLPAGRPVTRLAGQYLEILDGDSAYAFSIASAPGSGRDIELHVRHGEQNSSSLAVMDLLRREPVVPVRLPQGDCTLAGEPGLPLLLVVGSTGFAQAKAFVEHAIDGRWQVPISIYWGGRAAEDLYLDALARSWAAGHANIRYVPVLSGTSAAAGFRTGLVHEAVLADVADFSGLLVYACGSPAMVYATTDAFIARGLPADRIFSDVFSWAPRAGAS